MHTNSSHVTDNRRAHSTHIDVCYNLKRSYILLYTIIIITIIIINIYEKRRRIRSNNTDKILESTWCGYERRNECIRLHRNYYLWQRKLLLVTITTLEYYYRCFGFFVQSKTLSKYNSITHRDPVFLRNRNNHD